MDRGDQSNRRSPSPAPRSPRSQESELAPEDMASDCSGHSPQSSLAAAGTSAGKAAKKKVTKAERRRKRREAEALEKEEKKAGEGPASQLRTVPVVIHEFKASEPPAAVRAGKEQRRVTFEAAHPPKASPNSKGKGKKGGKSKMPGQSLRKGKGKGGGKKKQPGSTNRVLPPNLR